MSSAADTRVGDAPLRVASDRHTGGASPREDQLALSCAKAVAKTFADAGHKFHSIEVIVRDKNGRAITFASTIVGKDR